MVDERELERIKELVKKIIGYATDMMSGKFEYKIYYDKIQKQEVQYRSLKIELNNPNNFKTKRMQRTSYVALTNKSEYYKTRYAYPELEAKKDEFKALENQININRTNAGFAHNRFTMNQTLLYRFIENLEIEDLKNIIEYLDINMRNNYSGISSYDMTNIIYKIVTRDIGNLFESNIKVDLRENYRGPITIIEILIEYKEACEKNINIYNEIKQDLENREKQLKDSQILESILKGKINKIRKLIFNRIFEPKKLKQLKIELKEVEDKIGTLLGVSKYNEIHALNPSEYNRDNAYSKYINFSLYLNVMIDSVGEKSLKELIQKLKIDIRTTDDNYFDDIGEMRRILKEWFHKEEIRISELYNNTKTKLEDQKVLKK